MRASVAAEEMGLGKSMELSSTQSSMDLDSGSNFGDVTSRMTSKKMKTVRKKYGKKTKRKYSEKNGSVTGNYFILIAKYSGVGLGQKTVSYDCQSVHGTNHDSRSKTNCQL